MSRAVATETQYHTPVILVKDDRVVATSRDVAAYFDKRHNNVLRDIDALIAQEPSLVEGGLLSFEETLQVEPQNGQSYRCYFMTRDGFTLLAMGFTGAKALRFKMAYIEAFNRMETELRRQSQQPALDLNDAATLHALILTHTQKVMELESKVEEQAPTVKAYDRIAKSDGSFCITDAAKTLQVRPKDLFDYLRQHGWIYKRPGTSHDVSYQSHLVSGDLEHKTTTVLRADGTEKTVTQVRVTPKGLTKLAKLLSPPATLL